jgi:hypothetical protein
MIIIGNGNTNLFAFSNFIIIQLETMIKAYGEPISTVIGIYAFGGWWRALSRRVGTLAEGDFLVVVRRQAYAFLLKFK